MQVLPEFPVSHPAGAKYPWSRWTALDETGRGPIVQITRGEDFDTEPERMRQTITSGASQRGLRARTSVQGDNVIFQVRAQGVAA